MFDVRQLIRGAVFLFILMSMSALAGAEGPALTEQDFLTARGNRLLNRKEEQVLLRGVNLGGWLLQESWFTPVNKPDKGWGEWDTREVLEDRFGEARALALFDIYQDNWIRSQDLDIIQSMGMNCVRLPFWYRNFQREDGSYLGGEEMDNNPGFRRLDWLIEECAARGIYVILDMHGAPGFQSDDHSSGRTGASQLFEAGKAGEEYRLRTIELWTRIAARYRGHPAVAALDLLNEPMNGFSRLRKSDPVLWRFYDRLIKEIRAVNPEHILSVEGIWEMHNLPDPANYGWTNMLYQTHNYNWKKHEIDAKVQDILDRAHWQVPVLVGEFQSGGIWDYALSQYNSHHISWTTWTYKGTRSTLSDWFIYRNVGAPAIQPETDSYERIAEVWGQTRTEDGFAKDVSLARVLETYAREALVP